jgi:hypothetical protein
VCHIKSKVIAEEISLKSHFVDTKLYSLFCATNHFNSSRCIGSKAIASHWLKKSCCYELIKTQKQPFNACCVLDWSHIKN